MDSDKLIGQGEVLRRALQQYLRVHLSFIVIFQRFCYIEKFGSLFQVEGVKLMRFWQLYFLGTIIC